MAEYEIPARHPRCPTRHISDTVWQTSLQEFDIEAVRWPMQRETARLRIGIWDRSLPDPTVHVELSRAFTEVIGPESERMETYAANPGKGGSGDGLDQFDRRRTADAVHGVTLRLRNTVGPGAGDGRSTIGRHSTPSMVLNSFISASRSGTINPMWK